MADWLDVPIERYITAPREKYYVPGSLLKVEIDNRDPLAYGMPRERWCSSITVRFSNWPERVNARHFRSRFVSKNRL